MTSTLQAVTASFRVGENLAHTGVHGWGAHVLTGSASSGGIGGAGSPSGGSAGHCQTLIRLSAVPALSPVSGEQLRNGCSSQRRLQ